MSTIASHSQLNISETNRDRGLVQKDYNTAWAIAHGVSNGHMTDDVTWPRNVKLVITIRLERYISKTTGDAI